MMWLTLAGAIVLEVCGTLCMQASDAFRKKAWILPVALMFLASFGLLWLTLGFGMPVGIAYGVWSACGVALVALIARIWFKEPLTPLMVLGIALIIGGVLAIELTDSSH
jgi:small multidrug resistance pump